jgi:hypothetical protein
MGGVLWQVINYIMFQCSEGIMVFTIIMIELIVQQISRVLFLIAMYCVSC